MKLNRESIIREAYAEYYTACVEQHPNATHFGTFIAGIIHGLRLADTYGVESVSDALREVLDESDNQRTDE